APAFPVELLPQSMAQSVRRRVARGLAQGIAEIGGARRQFLARGAGLKMLFGLRGVSPAQFAVQITLGNEVFFASHRQSLAVSRKVARARARRDITVPMGTPVMSAIS